MIRHLLKLVWHRKRSTGLLMLEIAVSFLVVFAVALVAPVGILLGMPLPGGMRLVAADRADIIPWGWGINGAFSVDGATLAVFIAMNWGFSVTLFSAAVVYMLAALTLRQVGH
jgi:hypothetical protein